MHLHEFVMSKAGADNLTPKDRQRLLAEAGLMAEPLGMQSRLPRWLAAVGAGLLGLGVMFWVAAHWGHWGPVEQVSLIGAGLLLAGAAAAWAKGPLRLAAGLLAFALLGALFATIGQRYQTGADAWQFFAAWALLGLPLALGIRSDLVWAPWALISATGVAAWVHTHSAHRWRFEAQDLTPQLTGWLFSWALVALLAWPLKRYAGAGGWSLRLALLCATGLVAGSAAGGLFAPELSPQFCLGLALVLCALMAFWQRVMFDVFALSVLALAANGLVLLGLGRWLLSDVQGDPFFRMLLLGLISTALLSASVKLILRRNAQMDHLAERAGL